MGSKIVKEEDGDNGALFVGVRGSGKSACLLALEYFSKSTAKTKPKLDAQVPCAFLTRCLQCIKDAYEQNPSTVDFRFLRERYTADKVREILGLPQTQAFLTNGQLCPLPEGANYVFRNAERILSSGVRNSRPLQRPFLTSSFPVSIFPLLRIF